MFRRYIQSYVFQLIFFSFTLFLALIVKSGSSGVFDVLLHTWEEIKQTFQLLIEEKKEFCVDFMRISRFTIDHFVALRVSHHPSSIINIRIASHTKWHNYFSFLLPLFHSFFISLLYFVYIVPNFYRYT